MEGLVYILDQIGHTLAAKQAEVERLQAENAALVEALTQRAQPIPPNVMED